MKWLFLLLFTVQSGQVFGQDFRSEETQYRQALKLLYSEPPGNLSETESRRTVTESKKLLLDSYEKYSQWKTEGEGLALRAFHLAMVCWYLGEREQALVYFEISFKAFPFKGEALYNRFLILNESGRYGEARKEARRLADFKKNSNRVD